MFDQAQILRGLMERRSETSAAELPASRPQSRTVAVTSGKGGVGKSNIALNLAIALRTLGHNVCLLDANLGLGNIDLLCGLNGYWNLAHVITGARTLGEITLAGPGGVHVIPGASGLADVADCPPAAHREILLQLEELEQTHDFLIIDTGTGIHRAVRQFVAAADIVLVVTTSEPTSIADAYATIKTLTASREVAEPQVLVNQADSVELAREIICRLQQTARTFLHAPVGSAGIIPRDPALTQAVVRRVPLQIDNPRSPAARAIEQLARRVINLSQRPTTRGAFFAQFSHASQMSHTPERAAA